MFSKDTLEYNLILNKVSSYTLSESAKEAVLASEILLDSDIIRQRLSLTSELASIILRFGRLPFSPDYDQFELIKRIKLKRTLSIFDVLTLRLLLVMEGSFKSYLSKVEGDYPLFLDSLNPLVYHEQILVLINKIVNIDGEILDSASSNLLTIRNQIKKKAAQLDKVLATLLSKYQPYLNESLITSRNDRYVIPVNQMYKNKVRGIVHDTSASRQTVYIEPDDIRQLSVDLANLRVDENEEIIKILEAFTNEVYFYHSSLNSNIELFIKCDVIHAKAIYGNQINGVIPEVNKLGIIDLKGARHPLIDPNNVVAIDVTFDSRTKVILITGPNTGGKTVALKTVGLLTLMMQSALLIPAKANSKLAVFDSVFADIGDEQSIEQSLSTFSSHLTKIKKMTQNLADNQLILLDELGSGTDPQEGVALAIAILNKIRKYNIKALVTTHYSELKLYALEHDDIINASVAFDFNTLKPLYKLQLGISGMSQALFIAQRLGLDSEIIDDAKGYIGANQSNLAKMLERFNRDQQQLLLDKEKLEVSLLDLEKKRRDLTKEEEAFVLSQKKIIDEIKDTETKKHQKLQEELKQLIKELEVKSALTLPELSAIKQKANQSVDTNDKVVKFRDDKISVGDYVHVISYKQDGYVTDIKKDKYFVTLGQFKLDFKKSELTKLEKPKEVQAPPVKRNLGTTPSREASMEVDLRGVRYEEVKDILDHAIDRALLANYHSLRIIHGFGTGAVRSAVYDYIKRSSEIKSHRFGGEGEGLNGVTIITLI